MPPEANPNEQQPQFVQISQEQWDEMMANQQAERERNQELMQMLLTGNQQGQQGQQQPGLPPIQLDVNGLPDPREDYEGYQKGLADRMGKAFQEMQTRATDQATARLEEVRGNENLLNQAWAKIGEAYPDLAEVPEIVETAASQVYNQYAARGVNPQLAFRQDMDGMIEAIGKRAMGTLEKIRGFQQGADPGDETREDPDDELGRTFMLAETRPTSRQKPGVKQQPKANDDFVSSLKKLQKDQYIY